MPSRSVGLLCLFLVVIVVSACAERQSPFEPLRVPPPAMTQLPASGSGFLFVTSPADPSAIGSLPSYAEQLIAEVTVSGVISITSKYPDIKGSHQADPSGYWREDSIHGCYVKIVVTYSVQGAAWTPACSINPLQSTRTDSILIKGEGTIKRTGAVAQWPYECHYDSCWEYAGEQSYSIIPIPVPISLTTPLTAEASPGVIYLPAPGNWTLFKIVANPARLKSIDVPIRVISWQWTAATGGPGQTVLTGGATAIQRSVYITEPGAMVVNAVVNGVEQLDTVLVVKPVGSIRLVLQKSRIKFSVLCCNPVRDEPSIDTLTVSVVGTNGVAIPNKTVNLALAATEGSAGHIHTGGKPTGTLVSSVNTGASGVVKVVYTAPLVSGPVKISGTTEGAPAASVMLDIGQWNLEEILPGAHYQLIGHKEGQHMKNHFAKRPHLQKIQELADAYFAQFAEGPTLNDTSLPNGGLYDVDTIPWKPPHQSHGEGRSTDFRTIGLDSLQLRFVRGFWNKCVKQGCYLGDETVIRKAGQPNRPNTKNPHFHLTFGPID